MSRDRQTMVYAFAPYKDWLRQAILSFKYEGERARKDHLGILLIPTLKSLQPVDLFVPVPLHQRRERHRGYNQARLLAAVASASLGTPITDALVRKRDTPQQVLLTGNDRRVNVVSAFEIIGDIAGAHVVLIDDVVTTGATIDACADALRRGGAASVQAVTLAHG
jgi:ComF family protein